MTKHFIVFTAIWVGITLGGWILIDVAFLPLKAIVIVVFSFMAALLCKGWLDRP